MPTLVSQISPQRSTQYSQLASKLAAPEWRLSALRDKIVDIQPVDFAGQQYLRVELSKPLDSNNLAELGRFAMTCSHFEYFDRIGEQAGPFLRPLETGYEPSLPHEVVTARRYRGKTNELLTQFMCNVARFSSGFADRPWTELRLFDPLSGGGTTLFTGLMFGADVAGVEQDAQVASSTAAYLRQFCREQRIRCTEKQERLRKLGKRWTFTIGDKAGYKCIIAQGETQLSKELLASFKPHLIVTDLPYGVQHHGKLAGLMETALPVWLSLVHRYGSLVFSWDSTRFTRDQMVELVERSADVSVLAEDDYGMLAHRVDRVIKVRDILVLRPV